MMVWITKSFLSLLLCFNCVMATGGKDVPVSYISNAEAIALYDQGSYGFFQARGATDALAYMSWYDLHLSASDTWQNAQRTDFGDPHDATSLENMKAAIEYIKRANQLRAAYGKEPLKVSDTMMAIAQVNCNASATIGTHETMARNAGLTNRLGENMAISYADPFDFWYTYEKSIFDASGSSGATGHFENLINPNNRSDLQFTVTGFAVNTQYLDYNAGNIWANGNVTAKTYIQTFSFASGTGRSGYSFSSSQLYDVETYEKDFLAYYNQVKSDYTQALKAQEAERLENIRAFVSRLYLLCLGREADSGGLQNWTNQLSAGVMTAADVVKSFFYSKELTNQHLSNDAFVERCYQVMLDRGSDSSGKRTWLNRLNNGVTYTHILYGFVGSQEFTGICAKYGITRGSIQLTDPRDINYGVTSFVARCYTQILGRAYDTGGLKNWCSKILNAGDRRQAAIDTASNSFFHSKEFLNMRLSNEEYVKVLYRAFLGREYDSVGLKDWVSQLDTGKKTRDEVLYGFAYSQEFNRIMSQYGL